MINLRLARGDLSHLFHVPVKNITIKRKKKMVIEITPNGDTKLKRRNVIKIEIIE